MVMHTSSSEYTRAHMLPLTLQCTNDLTVMDSHRLLHRAVPNITSRR